MWELDVLSVSEWWKCDPSIVEQWTMVDFSNREEYMLIQLYLASNPEPVKPKKEPWKGPNR